MLVYDVTSRESFNNINKWINDMDKYGDINVVKILVGNKSDSKSRVVSTQEGEKFAAQCGLPFFETSALNGSHVGDV